MKAWQATVQDEAGNIVVNPSVSVYESGTDTLASIYNEDGSPKANPFLGGLEGFVQFWAGPGVYTIVGASGSSLTETWEFSVGVSVSPVEFGARGDGTSNDGAALSAWIASGQNLEARPEYEYRVLDSLSIPSGTKITGTLNIVYSSSSVQFIDIGNDVEIDCLNIRHDGVIAANSEVNIGSGFKCNKFTAKALVESGNKFVVINNEGADVGSMEFVNYTRPLVFGINGAVPTVGGVFRTIFVSTFIRALAVNNAYGWWVGSFVAKGRSAAASKVPGHNGILISGASDWRMDDILIDGAAEHAFRVGGSTVGGVSNNWSIGNLTTRNTGGSPLKLNDGTALVENWSVGTLTALGSLGAAPGRNSELLRLTHVRNGHIGIATARRNGGNYSVSGGLHVGDARDIHVGVLDIEDYLTEAVAVRDQDDALNQPVSRITVGYLRAVGSTNPILALASAAPVTDIQIADGYFDTTSSNLVAADTFSVISSPIEIAGYLKGGGEGVSGPAAAWANVRIRRANGSVTFGRGISAGGDLGLSATPFNPANVEATSFGGFHVSAQGVTAADGALGAGFSAARPSSPGRRGMAMVPFQDGAGLNSVGIGFYAGSNSTATNEMRNQWQFRWNGNIDFRNPSSGPVILSPNGTRYRIAVSDGGVLSAIVA